MRLSRSKTFEQVAMPHLDAVYRLARRLADSEAEAEDLVQEAYLRAFKAFDRFELRTYGAKPWLFRILHNAYYSRRQRANREPTLLDDVDFDCFTGELEPVSLESWPDAVPDWDAFDDELKNSVSQLPAEYRTVLLLWAFEDLSYKEIATVCNCKIGTVMSRLYRARQILSQRLAAYVSERNLASGSIDG